MHGAPTTVLFPEHIGAKKDPLQLMCTQGASQYAKMCLKIEELLPVSVLPLVNVVGRGSEHRNIAAGVRCDLVACVNRSIGRIFKY